MHTQKGKDIGRGDRPANALGGALPSEIEAEAADGGDLLKRLILRLVIEEVGGGEGRLLQTGLGFPEPDELVVSSRPSPPPPSSIPRRRISRFNKSPPSA